MDEKRPRIGKPRRERLVMAFATAQCCDGPASRNIYLYGYFGYNSRANRFATFTDGKVVTEC